MFGGGAGNMAGMMKKVQKMQADMLKMQEELEKAEYTATAGGGVVTAVISGKKELTSLVIEPDAVDPEDVEMLQDLVLVAVNEALRKIEALSEERMAKATGGRGMPMGF